MEIENLFLKSFHFRSSVGILSVKDFCYGYPWYAENIYYADYSLLRILLLNIRLYKHSTFILYPASPEKKVVVYL